MIGAEQSALCVNCHNGGSKGYAAAAQMKAGIVGLKNDLTGAEVLLHKAEKAGMEVGKPIYELTEGKDRLVLARVNVHYFDPGSLQKVLDEGEGIAKASTISGIKALNELAYRRKGLAVSAGILLIMIALLLLKIRQISRHSA